MIGRIAASFAAMVLVVVGTTVLVNGLSAPQETNFGGIRCGEVKQLAQDYLSGELKEKEPELAQRIADHVVKCPRCTRMFDQMREEMGMPPIVFLHDGCEECDDPNCPHHDRHGANPHAYLAHNYLARSDEAHRPAQLASR